MSTENANPALNVEKSIVILLDVAGTTTSNVFLKENLFSYVDKQIETFLKETWEDETVKEAVKLLKDEDLDQEAATALIKELTKNNSENKGLKTIQGLIYKKGYKDGELKAHVFPDVPAALELWSKSRKIAIYSTGSQESQQLLFSHTTEGDLSAHISKYFDQSIGSKTEPTSYEKISKEFEIKPEEILFITDNVTEAKAAKTAGAISVLITREGNDALPEESSKELPVISSFKEIVFDKSIKRKNEEETAPTEEERPTKIAKTESEVKENLPVVPETSSTTEKAEDEAMEVDGPLEDKNNEKTVTAVIEKTEETTAKETETTATKVIEGESSEKQQEIKTEEITDKKTETTASKGLEGESSEKQQELKTEQKSEELTTTETDNISKEPIKEIDAKDNKVDSEKMEVESKEEESETDKTKTTEKVDEDKVDTQESESLVTEKETKSDLANGVEKETKCPAKQETEKTTTKEAKEVTNENKQNGGSSINTESKEEEVKVKKMEEPAAESAPTVSEGESSEKQQEIKTEQKSEESSTTENENISKESKQDEKVDTTDNKVDGEKVEVKSKESSDSNETGKPKTTEKMDEDKVEIQESDSLTEKENKSDLANGVEKETKSAAKQETNGTTEETTVKQAKEVANGTLNVENKQNGEPSKNADSNVEDIKVKKMEEPAAESAPPVSVEV